MSTSKVSGVVLAAGFSRRFGDNPPKQLALVEGEPLVRRTVRRALDSDLSEVVVVIGWRATEVESAIRDLGIRVVENPRYAQGQSTSIKAGLAAVTPVMDAAMFIPIDQPRLSVEALNALIVRYRQGGAAIVVPTFAGRRHAPVLMDRAMFGFLAVLEGDVGGRQIFGAHPERIAEVALATDDPLRDVDTLAALREMGN